MRKNNIFRYAFLATLMLAFAVSCKYDDVVPPVVTGVSFSNDIIPIFNASCNVTGCHNGVGHTPDLRESVAYDQLWEGMYVDTMIPEDSELYLWLNGEKGLPMPLEGVNQSYVSTVLAWIQEGALNN